MTRLLSLAHLTAIDLAPPALIRAAAVAGFDAVGLRLLRVTETSPGYPLMSDRSMMRDTKAALRETGLSVHDIEFVRITPEIDIAALDPFLDAGAELGAREVIAAPYDPDLPRLSARLADLSERARSRGLGVSLEFFPWTVVPNLASAVTLAESTDPDLGILVDALHFDRSDSSLDLLTSLPRRRLRVAHLCDAPVHPLYAPEDLLHTARAERLPPGEGGIDLLSFIAALPADLPLGVEVPMTRLAGEAGPEAVIARVAAAARSCLRQVQTGG